MTVGNPLTFAIESDITQAYEQVSFRALGFFVIHIGGRAYGIREADATMLACSLDEVNTRLAKRGLHTASFVIESALEIANIVRYAIYADHEEGRTLFGLSRKELAERICSSHLIWAPDGDEAFDDGSYVLQFDVGHRVRLIGFRCLPSGNCDPETLADVWIDENEFYSTLKTWSDGFLAEWKRAPKQIP